MVEDTSKAPFVDTEAAARYLALHPHSLERYCLLGGGPPLHKLVEFVRYRYAVADFTTWAEGRRWSRIPGDGSQTYAPLNQHEH
jgi:hypothetical protein